MDQNQSTDNYQYQQQQQQYYQYNQQEQSTATVETPQAYYDYNTQQYMYYPSQQQQQQQDYYYYQQQQQNHSVASYYLSSVDTQNPASVAYYPPPPSAAGASSHSQIAQRGGGRRGGRSFRGGGSSRGRGRGGGRGFQPRGAVGTLASANASGPVAVGVQPPPRMAWCELCKVECNTQEILEQHKNGKKHQKNFQKLNSNNAMAGQKGVEIQTSHFSNAVVQSTNAVVSEEKDHQQFSSSGVDSGDHINESGQTVMAASVEQPEMKSGNKIGAQGNSLKRKMKGGRGGKFIRTNDRTRRLVKPDKPKPPPVHLHCSLCNVTCESQVVYDSHVAGKKHLSKLRRFPAQAAMYGQAGVQSLLPPDTNGASSSIISQIQHGINVNDPQIVLSQLLTLIAQAQASGSVGPSISGLATSSETQYPNPPVQVGTHLGPPIQVEAHSNLPVQVEATPTVRVDAKEDDGASVLETNNSGSSS